MPPRFDEAGDQERTADWFYALGYELRTEIDAAATAIDHWGDLASDVREDEWQKYFNRDERIPSQEGGDDG